MSISIEGYRRSARAAAGGRALDRFVVAGCPQLKNIVIPNGVTCIGEQILIDNNTIWPVQHQRMVIRCARGSVAHQYALSCHFPVSLY